LPTAPAQAVAQQRAVPATQCKPQYQATQAFNQHAVATITFATSSADRANKPSVGARHAVLERYTWRLSLHGQFSHPPPSDPREISPENNREPDSSRALRSAASRRTRQKLFHLIDFVSRLNQQSRCHFMLFVLLSLNRPNHNLSYAIEYLDNIFVIHSR
jgi:hypothetical protein